MSYYLICENGKSSGCKMNEHCGRKTINFRAIGLTQLNFICVVILVIDIVKKQHHKSIICISYPK